jgi:hypothetical protein
VIDAAEGLDLGALAKGIIAALGARFLQELDDPDMDRKAAITDAVKAWNAVAVAHSKPGEGPKDVTPAKSSAPAFKLSEFKARAEAKAKPDPST